MYSNLSESNCLLFAYCWCAGPATTSTGETTHSHRCMLHLVPITSPIHPPVFPRPQDESVAGASAPAPPANTQPYEAPSWAQTAVSPRPPQRITRIQTVHDHDCVHSLHSIHSTAISPSTTHTHRRRCGAWPMWQPKPGVRICRCMAMMHSVHSGHDARRRSIGGAQQGEDAAKQAATQAAQDPAVQRAVVGAAGSIAQDQANQAMDAQKKKWSEMPKPWFIMRMLNGLILVCMLCVCVCVCACVHVYMCTCVRGCMSDASTYSNPRSTPRSLLGFPLMRRFPSHTWRGPRRSRAAVTRR